MEVNGHLHAITDLLLGTEPLCMQCIRLIGGEKNVFLTVDEIFKIVL